MTNLHARNPETRDDQAWTSIDTRRASGWLEAAQRRRVTARLPQPVHEEDASRPGPASPFLRLVQELFDGVVQAAGFGLILAIFLLTIYLTA